MATGSPSEGSSGADRDAPRRDGGGGPARHRGDRGDGVQGPAYAGGAAHGRRAGRERRPGRRLAPGGPPRGPGGLPRTKADKPGGRGGKGEETRGAPPGGGARGGTRGVTLP